MTTVGIITARGQSKQLARKNLRLLAGRPLLAHTIEAARGARSLDRVVVTTDDAAIARAAIVAGAEVPFMRPAELASDVAASVDAVRHAVAQLEAAGDSIDIVVTLQPTSPFRSAAHIDAAVDLLRRRDADSVVTVASLDIPISVLGYLDDDAFVRLAEVSDVRRQAAPRSVRLTGAIYVTRRALLDEGRLVGDRPIALELEGTAAIDIDTAEDLAHARSIARRGRRR